MVLGSLQAADSVGCQWCVSGAAGCLRNACCSPFERLLTPSHLRVLAVAVTFQLRGPFATPTPGSLRHKPTMLLQSSSLSAAVGGAAPRQQHHRHATRGAAAAPFTRASTSSRRRLVVADASIKEVAAVPVMDKGELSTFPEQPAVYAVLSPDGQVQYIGLTRKVRGVRAGVCCAAALALQVLCGCGMAAGCRHRASMHACTHPSGGDAHCVCTAHTRAQARHTPALTRPYVSTHPPLRAAERDGVKPPARPAAAHTFCQV
jgi:hypothetical protein